MATLKLMRPSALLSTTAARSSRSLSGRRWSTWLARRWPHLLTLVLLVAFCWLLAQWIWYFLEPKPAALLPRPQQNLGANFNPGTTFGLFGALNAAAPVVQKEAVPTTLNVQLKGVFAEQGNALARAILVVDGKEVPVQVGEQFLPGVTLKAVFATHVLLDRGGASEKVQFPEQPGGGPSMGMPQQAMLRAPGQPIPAPGNQFRLNVQPVAPNVMSFSRNQLQDALDDVSQLSNLGRVGAAAGGGVVLEEVPPGSLAERLGLQRGDVVKQINGHAVNSPADLMNLYQEFDNANQVNVSGARAGRPLQLTYNVQQ